MYWVDINENTATVSGSGVIVQNNVNVVNVKFSFSEEWDDLTKVLVFRSNSKTIAVPNPATYLVTIPWECCVTIGDTVFVGAYGIDDAGTIVRPTTWASLSRVVDGVDVDAVADPSPSDDILSTIVGAVGDLSDDLDAINNRLTNMGENLSDIETDLETYSQHPNLYGRDEPEQHPIEAVTGLKEALTPNYLTPDELQELIGGKT